MNCCQRPQCQGIENLFDESQAERDLEKYLDKGPAKTTKILIEQIKSLEIENATLLDIGGGVGAIQYELLNAGAAKAIHVDASSAYIKIARQEAADRDLDTQIEYHIGNFVELAPEIGPADIVTLDRVICCYDDMPSLVSLSAKKAKRLVGLVFPRDTWWIKMGVQIANWIQRIRKDPFFVFAHSAQAVEDILLQHGFTKQFMHKGIFWQVVVYRK